MDPSSKEDENPNDGKLIGQKWDHHLAKKWKKNSWSIFTLALNLSPPQERKVQSDASKEHSTQKLKFNCTPINNRKNSQYLYGFSIWNSSSTEEATFMSCSMPIGRIAILQPRRQSTALDKCCSMPIIRVC
jgi:hypothetical protein